MGSIFRGIGGWGRPLTGALLGVVLVGTAISAPVSADKELRYRYVATTRSNVHWTGVEQGLNQASGESWKLGKVDFHPVDDSFTMKVTDDALAVVTGVPVHVAGLDDRGEVREVHSFCLLGGELRNVPVDSATRRVEVRILNSADNYFTCRLLATGSSGILAIRP